MEIQVTEKMMQGWILEPMASGIAGLKEHFLTSGYLTNHGPSLSSTYAHHEKKKRRNYQQRVLEIERASFTPLVFSASGGMAKAAQVCYKRLAGLLAEKRKEPYSKIMGWMRTKLSFCLLRSAILCVRGSRQKVVFQSSDPAGVVMSEAHLSK